MRHVALLGDSSFDNRVYTGGEPDVATHLRDVVGASTKVTLLALDGSTTLDMGRQIDRVEPSGPGGRKIAEAIALTLSFF